MKRLIADYLKINEIDIREFCIRINHDLSPEIYNDYGSTIREVTGEIYEPRYEVKLTSGYEKYIQLSELLEFIYSKIDK